MRAMSSYVASLLTIWKNQTELPDNPFQNKMHEYVVALHPTIHAATTTASTFLGKLFWVCLYSAH